VNGPTLVLGRKLQEVVDFNDSISLVEERGGASKKIDSNNSKSDSQDEMRRGRSRKPREKSKNPKNSKNINLGKPKFVQLGEALKEGGGRRKKKQGGEEKGRGSDSGDAARKGLHPQPSCDYSSSTYVPESDQGLILEVVLPFCQSTPNSGFALLQQGGVDSVPQQQSVKNPEPSKLLKLQQQVGFNYTEPDEEVIKILANDEQCDRKKKQEWEQKNGLQ
jgi:hypothetical protein